jgi:hypothetical protein
MGITPFTGLTHKEFKVAYVATAPVTHGIVDHAIVNTSTANSDRIVTNMSTTDSDRVVINTSTADTSTSATWPILHPSRRSRAKALVARAGRSPPSLP